MDRGKIILYSGVGIMSLLAIGLIFWLFSKTTNTEEESRPSVVEFEGEFSYEDMMKQKKEEDYKPTNNLQENDLEFEQQYTFKDQNDIYSNENRELDSLLNTFKEEKVSTSRQTAYQSYNEPTQASVQSQRVYKTSEVKEVTPTKEEKPKSRFNYITEGISSLNSHEYEENKLYEAQILEAQIVSEKDPYIRIRTKQKIGEVPANTTLMAKVSFSESRLLITTDLVKINDKLISFKGEVYNNLGKRGLDVKSGKGVEINEELNKSGEGELEKVVNEKVGWGGSLVNLIFKRKGKVKINSANIFLKMEKEKN